MEPDGHAEFVVKTGLILSCLEELTGYIWDASKGAYHSVSGARVYLRVLG